MRKPILVIGSVNLDLVASVLRIPVPGETVTGYGFHKFLGGKGANQAVAVARLGYPVKLVANVGDDDIGKQLRKGLKDAGVGTEAVRVAKQNSSGIALIAAEPAGQNIIIVIPGANGRLLPRDVTKYESKLAGAGMILTQLETPLETLIHVAALAQRHKVPLMLDPAPARELPPELLGKVTWLTPNESEACFLCGQPPGTINADNVKTYAEELLRRGPENVVIKMGAQGAFLGTNHGEQLRILVPAFRVQAVDATGAGDAFNAGLAVALMQQRQAADATRFAGAVAALSVTKPGAQSAMPSRRDVLHFLRERDSGKAGKTTVGVGQCGSKSAARLDT